jgi:hypothetical protein
MLAALRRQDAHHGLRFCASAHAALQLDHLFPVKVLLTSHPLPHLLLPSPNLSLCVLVPFQTFYLSENTRRFHLLKDVDCARFPVGLASTTPREQLLLIG